MSYPCETVQKPFSKDSPVNLTPILPVLTPANIPKDKYSPAVNCSSFSTPVYVTQYGSPTAVVTAKDQDGEYTDSLTLARIPANMIPAPGTDGHVVVIDTFSGIVHSFQNLSGSNGQYSAVGWAYARLNGTGFGTRTRPHKGVRAICCSLAAGLITATDIADGSDVFNYALMMSLTYSGLSKSKVWPAAGMDSDVSKNTGSVPYGAHLMLPPTFDLSKLTNKFVRRVAKTLRTRGGIVGDRNDGCPFALYVQQGVDMSKYSADGNFDADMDTIRAVLMIASDPTLYLDGNGLIYAPGGTECHSLRGTWRSTNGGPAIAGLHADPITGALNVTAAGTYINYDNRAILGDLDGLPQDGDSMMLRVYVSDPNAVVDWNLQGDTGIWARGKGPFSYPFKWAGTNFASYIRLVSTGPCKMMISLVNQSR